LSSKIRVGLIFGGRSGEHEVSLASASSVYNALDKNKYEVTLIGIDKTGRWLLPEQSLLLAHQANPMAMKLNAVHGAVSLVPYDTKTQIVAATPSQAAPSLQKLDVIIPILHGTYGEDGTLQGLLEMANIPFVGSGVLGSAIGMDKDVARRLLQVAGIPVVPTMSLRKGDFKTNSKKIMAEIFEKFSLPFFVKPANAGSSVGVHKVKTRDQLEGYLQSAFEYDTKVLVEKGVDARELEVSVLGNSQPKASMVGEIIPNHEFYSYEAKYLDENGASYHIPAKDLPAELIKRIQELAIAGFQALELRGLARVDFFLDKKTNELYLNEVNTIPGFTKISMYPKLWEVSGLPYAALLDELIRLALEHHKDKSELKTSFS
jgi:D-alanine-D-alanine ligase